MHVMFYKHFFGMKILEEKKLKTGKWKKCPCILGSKRMKMKKKLTHDLCAVKNGKKAAKCFSKNKTLYTAQNGHDRAATCMSHAR